MPTTETKPDARTTASLPHPFYDLWDPGLRPAIRALWHWHSALADPQMIGANGTSSTVDQFFEEETERAAEGTPMRMIRESVWQDAYAVCEEYDLDRNLLAQQVDASQRLQGTTRFETTAQLKSFVRRWAVSQGRLLAGLVGADNTFQVGYVDELSRGFFHVGRLITLPKDVERGRLFLSIEDVKQADVSVEQLRDGAVNENVRRLLWKQAIRVRDALAQGQPLMNELPTRLRLSLKYWWLGALEMVNEVERRDFDVWSQPVELSLFRRVQVMLQTVFGRASAS